MGTALPAFQALRQHHPRDSKGGRNPWTWIFLLVDAMFADGQLALGSEQPCRQDGFRLQQCGPERDRVYEKLAHEPKGLLHIPPHLLKHAHARKIPSSYVATKHCVSSYDTRTTEFFGWTAHGRCPKTGSTETVRLNPLDVDIWEIPACYDRRRAPRALTKDDDNERQMRTVRPSGAFPLLRFTRLSGRST